MKLLATDLDGTLVGNAYMLEQLNKILEENRPGLLIAYATGRHKDSAVELIGEEKLLIPDFLVCNVGTEIHSVIASSHYQLDPGWKKRLLRTGWDREKLEGLLRDIPELALQEEACQREFKLSYYLTENAEEVLRKIEQRLSSFQMNCKVIYSVERCLDILPAAAGKGAALEYLQQKLSLERSQVLVCGDSGNDLDMLSQGFWGAIVGNAEPQLKKIYLPNVYIADDVYAGGIMEAIRHFHFLES